MEENHFSINLDGADGNYGQIEAERRGSTKQMAY
jgi:hypothetical protein